MARIRTLKPEFFNSPSTAQADLAVRLTFQAMWNWADDSGHGTANLKELEAFAWPNDTITELPRRSRGNSGATPGHWRSFAEVCGEVAEAYGVVFYRVRHRPYYWIPNFRQHQSKDYRPETRHPLVEEGEIFDVTSGEAIPGASLETTDADAPASRRGNSGDDSGDAALGTGEQGNRGTGEKEAPAKPKRPSVSRIPDDFEITSEMRAWATEKVPGLNIEWATEGFIDYWRAATKNAVKKDWPATWRGWMRRNFEDGKLGPQQGKPFSLDNWKG